MNKEEAIKILKVIGELFEIAKKNKRVKAILNKKLMRISLNKKLMEIKNVLSQEQNTNNTTEKN